MEQIRCRFWCVRYNNSVRQADGVMFELAKRSMRDGAVAAAIGSSLLAAGIALKIVAVLRLFSSNISDFVNLTDTSTSAP
jgi:Flp pilus assembly pilin Flp